MKKLLFIILLFSTNILTFGANVYFLNSDTGYLYTNGQSFYSIQQGYAPVAYHIWADPAKYNHEGWGARFKDPAGNWSEWSELSSPQGVHSCLRSGTWEAQGRVWVNSDVWGGHNYWMYTNFTLYFYVVDNNAPAIPQNLSVTSYNGHPKLQWNTNTESDLEKYVIYKKESEEAGYQYCGETTSTSFADGTESTQGSCPCHLAYYKIKAVDSNANASNFSSVVSIQVEGAGMEKKGNVNNFTTDEYFLDDNYPNPFNPVTTIKYILKESGLVSLKVFDNLGNEVANLVNEVKPEGIFEVKFDASKLPSGVYIYSIRVNDFVQNQKMILLK